MRDLQSSKSSPAARCSALRQRPIMPTSYAIVMGTLHFYLLVDLLFLWSPIMESVMLFKFVVPNKAKLTQTTSPNSWCTLWEQTTKQPSEEGGYRAALKSLHQLVMDGFRRTATYPSNGWVENRPLQFFLGFSPVLLQDHANYLPVRALQRALNAPICAAFATATIVPRKKRFLMTNALMTMLMMMMRR